MGVRTLNEMLENQKLGQSEKSQFSNIDIYRTGGTIHISESVKKEKGISWARCFGDSLMKRISKIG